MSAAAEILSAIKSLALARCVTFSSIENGSLSIGAGLACYVAASGTEDRYLDKAAAETVTISINGKHENLFLLFNDLEAIGTIDTMSAYPSGSGWQISNIETTSPVYVGQEESTGMWMYNINISISYSKEA